MGLTSASNLSAEYNMDFFEQQDLAQFEGRNFSMEYGAIIMYVYKNKIIPVVTGDTNATSSAALIKWLLDTESLATAICASDEDGDDGKWTPSQDYTWLSFKKDTIKTILDSVATVGGTKVDEWLSSVTDLGVIKLQTAGSFATVDSDKNFSMDKLNQPNASQNNINGKIIADNPTGEAEALDIDLIAHGSAVEK
jgi:hypothetical protein